MKKLLIIGIGIVVIIALIRVAQVRKQIQTTSNSSTSQPTETALPTRSKEQDKESANETIPSQIHKTITVQLTQSELSQKLAGNAPQSAGAVTNMELVLYEGYGELTVYWQNGVMAQGTIVVGSDNASLTTSGVQVANAGVLTTAYEQVLTSALGTALGSFTSYQGKALEKIEIHQGFVEMTYQVG